MSSNDTLSAASAEIPPSDSAPAARTEAIRISSAIFPYLPRLSATDRRMPERGGAFQQCHHTIEDGARHRRDGDLRPNHIDIHPPNLGRNAKAHADDRSTEELRDNGPDQGER